MNMHSIPFPKATELQLHDMHSGLQGTDQSDRSLYTSFHIVQFYHLIAFNLRTFSDVLSYCKRNFFKNWNVIYATCNR
jgi:hypothetical protein